MSTPLEVGVLLGAFLHSIRLKPRTSAPARAESTLPFAAIGLALLGVFVVLAKP